MSVSVALLSSHGGVVASDSMSRNADTGHISYDCDKTFVIAEHNIIGTYVGLVEFQELAVEQHIRRATTDVVGGDLSEFVAILGARLVERLEKSKVIHQRRRMEILLIGKAGFVVGDMEIHTLDVRPDTAKSSLLLYDGHISPARRLGNGWR